MAFNVNNTPYGAAMELANQGGAAVARRENADRSIGWQIQSDQFNAGMSQRDSQFQQSRSDRFRTEQAGLADRERQRIAEIERMGYAAELQQQRDVRSEQSAMLGYQEQQRLELEQSFDYTPEQQVELKRIQDGEHEIDQREASGAWSPQQAMLARSQLQRKRAATRPSVPKRMPLDDYQDVPLGTGTYKFMPEGYRGGPAFFNPQSGMFLHDEVEMKKQEDQDNRRLEHDLKVAQVKAESPEAIEAAKAAKAAELQADKEAKEFQMFATIASKFMTEKLSDGIGGESLAFGDDQKALEKAKKVLAEFKAMQGAQPGGDGESIVSVATPEEAWKLPSGTMFRTPDGRTKRRP